MKIHIKGRGTFLEMEVSDPSGIPITCIVGVEMSLRHNHQHYSLEIAEGPIFDAIVEAEIPELHDLRQENARLRGILKDRNIPEEVWFYE